MAAPDILKKMYWKEGQELLLVNVPDELLPAFNTAHSKSADIRDADFIIVFVQNSDVVRKYAADLAALDLAKSTLWIAYPKKSSSIDSDLTRDSLWNLLRGSGLTGVSQRSMNDDWSVIRFKPEEAVKHSEKGSLDVPPDLISLLQTDEDARAFFYKLSATNRKEYIGWITGAKKPETRQRRLDQILNRLNQGLRNPSEKVS